MHLEGATLGAVLNNTNKHTHTKRGCRKYTLTRRAKVSIPNNYNKYPQIQGKKHKNKKAMEQTLLEIKTFFGGGRRKTLVFNFMVIRNGLLVEITKYQT